MEYLLIPGSGTQMSDGLGNACHFLKAHRHTQSTLLMECAKAQSQKLTELSGHFRLTHLQDGSFLRFPRWQRHNIRFCTLKEKKKKDVTLLSIIAAKLRKTERCQMAWNVSSFHGPSVSPRTRALLKTPRICTALLCLHFNFLRAPEAIQFYSLSPSSMPPWHECQTETTLLPPFNHRMTIFQHNRGAVCALSFTAFLWRAIYFLPFLPWYCNNLP